MGLRCWTGLGHRPWMKSHGPTGTVLVWPKEPTQGTGLRTYELGVQRCVENAEVAPSFTQNLRADQIQLDLGANCFLPCATENPGVLSAGLAPSPRSARPHSESVAGAAPRVSVPPQTSSHFTTCCPWFRWSATDSFPSQ